MRDQQYKLSRRCLLKIFILRAWGRAAWSGSGYVYEIRISDISAGQCMFRRYVFFTAKIWMDQKVETEKSCTEKKEHRRKIALQRVVKEPSVFFHGKCCAIRRPDIRVKRSKSCSCLHDKAFELGTRQT